jgi:hypothetical protein
MRKRTTVAIMLVMTIMFGGLVWWIWSIGQQPHVRTKTALGASQG